MTHPHISMNLGQLPSVTPSAQRAVGTNRHLLGWWLPGIVSITIREEWLLPGSPESWTFCPPEAVCKSKVAKVRVAPR